MPEYDEDDDRYHEVWRAQRREIPTLLFAIVFGAAVAVPALAFAYYLIDRATSF